MVRVLLLALANFNPRTREGCDGKRRYFYGRTIKISIHAPVKGATHDPGTFVIFQVISIHAPVKGATRPPRTQMSLRGNKFQSTHP